MRGVLVLAVLAAALAGCRKDYVDVYPPWKKSPDLYQIDTNAPYARVTVYDDDGRVLGSHLAGETFDELDEDGIVEVTAEGYYPYKGPVSGMEVMGKKSWYVKLRRREPAAMER